MFDLSVFFDSDNNVVHIRNVAELEALAECLDKNGHKPIEVDIFRSEASDGDLAFRLYKSGTADRLRWVWAGLESYTRGLHNIYTLNDLRRHTCTDLGELSDDVQIAGLFT